jgi:hypothetical protein
MHGVRANTTSAPKDSKRRTPSRLFVKENQCKAVWPSGSRAEIRVGSTRSLSRNTAKSPTRQAVQTLAFGSTPRETLGARHWIGAGAGAGAGAAAVETHRHHKPVAGSHTAAVLPRKIEKHENKYAFTGPTRLTGGFLWFSHVRIQIAEAARRWSSHFLLLCVLTHVCGDSGSNSRGTRR